MNHKNTIITLQDLLFSENKPDELKPVDIALITYLLLRQTEDHFIFDSQLTLANRLGCERKTIGDSVKRLEALKWITTNEPWQWNPTTKRKTRRMGSTVGLAVNLDKLPQAMDRTKHSKPSPEAVRLAMKHTGSLIKWGVGKRTDKNFKSQQEHAAQRIIDGMGGYLEAIDLWNFAQNDRRFKKSVKTSLYAMRTRLSPMKEAFEAAIAAGTIKHLYSASSPVSEKRTQ